MLDHIAHDRAQRILRQRNVALGVGAGLRLRLTRSPTAGNPDWWACHNRAGKRDHVVAGCIGKSDGVGIGEIGTSK